MSIYYLKEVFPIVKKILSKLLKIIRKTSRVYKINLWQELRKEHPDHRIQF